MLYEVITMLTNWQSIEYTTSQNFDRRAFDYVNAILVVPGAIGAFRREAIRITSYNVCYTKLLRSYRGIQT